MFSLKDFIFAKPNDASHLEIHSLLNQLSSFSSPDSAKSFSHFLSQANVYAIACYYQSNIVGFGFISVTCMPRGGFLGTIHEVIVHQSYRGSGIGAQIVKELLDVAKNQFSCFKVELSCSSTNVKFYSRLGFESDGNFLFLKL